MITIINSMKIIDEINRLLVEKYPKHTIYIDLCPKKFDRPSFLIEFITVKQRPANRSTIQKTGYYSITCFDITNDYSHSSTIDLLTVQQGVLEIFEIGYIEVDGRAIEVKASSGGRNFDQAYIDLQFEYFDDRPNHTEEIPKMKEVYVTMKEE